MQEGRDLLEDTGINMKIILQLVSSGCGGSVLADRTPVITIVNIRIL
jgi:nucleoside recognition membrane protein YjiH